jgi:hypothetical protein
MGEERICTGAESMLDRCLEREVVQPVLKPEPVSDPGRAGGIGPSIECRAGHVITRNNLTSVPGQTLMSSSDGSPACTSARAASKAAALAS